MPEIKNLISNAKNGCEKSYTIIYEIYVDNLFYYLQQFTRDTDQIKEWIQRAFLKAFRNLDSFRMESSFKTWLFKISINEMRADFSLKYNQNKESLDNNLHEWEDELDNSFEWEYDMKLLLSKLDEIKKNVFILYEIENFSHSEISDILNISKAASRSILCRTKKYLQEEWLKLEVKDD